jgi:hypothetical protein
MKTVSWQNQLNIGRNRLLLFWTICVHRVCYAPFRCIYLRLFTGVSYVNQSPSSKQHHRNRVTAHTQAQPMSNVFIPAMTIASNASGFYDMMDTMAYWVADCVNASRAKVPQEGLV